MKNNSISLKSFYSAKDKLFSRSSNSFLENYKNKDLIFANFEKTFPNENSAKERVAGLMVLIMALLKWDHKASADDHNRVIKLIKLYDNTEDYAASIWYVTLVDYDCELFNTVIDFYKNKFNCDNNFASCLIADYMLAYHKNYTVNSNFIKYKEFIMRNNPNVISTMEHFIEVDRVANNDNYSMSDFYMGLSNEYKLGVVI